MPRTTKPREKTAPEPIDPLLLRSPDEKDHFPYLKVRPALTLVLASSLGPVSAEFSILAWFLAVASHDVALNSPGWIRARVDWLAQDLVVTQRTVYRGLMELIARGLIQRQGKEFAYRLSPQYAVKGTWAKISKDNADIPVECQYSISPDLRTREHIKQMMMANYAKYDRARYVAGSSEATTAVEPVVARKRKSA